MAVQAGSTRALPVPGWVERNRDPILAVIKSLIPSLRKPTPTSPLRVLELAAGSGHHGHYFARHVPELQVQPSDLASEDNRWGGLPAIAALQQEQPLTNVLPPIALDVSEDPWPLPLPDACYDLVLCINMIHIAPWTATQGLMRGASRALCPATGALLLYGPYRVDGRLEPESNVAFDASLRQRNKEWGIRDLDAVVAEANQHGLGFQARQSMPANNHCILFRRLAPAE